MSKFYRGSKFFNGDDRFKNFNQGVKRPDGCYAKQVIEEYGKIISVECGCGKIHPVNNKVEWNKEIYKFPYGDTLP